MARRPPTGNCRPRLPKHGGNEGCSREPAPPPAPWPASRAVGCRSVQPRDRRPDAIAFASSRRSHETRDCVGFSRIEISPRRDRRNRRGADPNRGTTSRILRPERPGSRLSRPDLDDPPGPNPWMATPPEPVILEILSSLRSIGAHDEDRPPERRKPRNPGPPHPGAGPGTGPDQDLLRRRLSFRPPHRAWRLGWPPGHQSRRPRSDRRGDGPR